MRKRNNFEQDWELVILTRTCKTARLLSALVKRSCPCKTTPYLGLSTLQWAFLYILCCFLPTGVYSDYTKVTIDIYSYMDYNFPHTNQQHRNTLTHAAGTSWHCTSPTNAPTPCMRDYHQSLTPSFYPTTVLFSKAYCF